MKSSRILHFFDRVLTSDEAGFQKPGKEIFNHSLTACKASKNKSVMIGDDFEADIAGAANFGMDQVFYVNGKEPLKMAFQPTYVIKDISELMEIL
jgi:putative hydrolase of the HAD superfamily